jgi:hypothetical protein
MRLLILLSVVLAPLLGRVGAAVGSPPPGATASEAPAAGPPPRAAPLLDKDKGARAAAAYRAAFARFCERRGEGGAGGRASDRASVGIVPWVEDIEGLCKLKPSPRALASGSFLRAGADEVLLTTYSGVGAGRDGELLVMRADAQGAFRLQPWVALGGGFETHARFTVEGRADALFLCEPHGRQGLYPSDCGFFGQGAFQGQRPDVPEPEQGPSTDDDLRLGFTTACGPSTAIVLHDVSLADGKIVVALVVEKVVRSAKGPDEGGDSCSVKKVISRWPVPIAYEVLAKRVRRTTPLPKRLKDVISSSDYY